MFGAVMRNLKIWVAIAVDGSYLLSKNTLLMSYFNSSKGSFL